MLKYIKRAYVMSVASYLETPKWTEVQDENNNGTKLDDLLLKSLEWDNTLSQDDKDKLMKVYNEEKSELEWLLKINQIDVLKETIKAKADTLSTVFAEKIISQFYGKKWEFVLDDDNTIDFNPKGFDFWNDDTLFDKDTVDFANKLGVTWEMVNNKINILIKEKKSFSKNNKEEKIKIAQEWTEKSTEVPSKEYTVVVWDNLTKIAKNNKVSVADILKVNPEIKDKNRIKIGQKIVIPTKKVK